MKPDQKPAASWRLDRRAFLQSTAGAAACLWAARGANARALQHVTWLKQVQQSPANLSDTAVKLQPLMAQHSKSLSHWKQKRVDLTQWWTDYLAPFQRGKRHLPRFDVLETENLDGITRQLIRYDAEPNLPTEAYLLTPRKVERLVPGAVVFHSTVNHSIRQPAGVEGKPEKAFGLKLAQRGYVVLCPRNFLWPDNHHIAAKQETRLFFERHPESTGMAKMLYDAQLALDLLASLPHVDSQRLAAVGHSLGAKEVLYLAAFDQRVKVTVSSEGGIGTGFSNWDAPWYLGPRVKQPGFAHEHHELLGMIAPRPFLLLGGDSADGIQSWPFITAALPIYQLYGSPSPLGLYNHHLGHNVPPEAERRLYQWLETYL